MIVTVVIWLLFILHGGLFVWSLGGFLEWILPTVPWEPFSNREFPRWLLLIHWLSVLFASAGFLVGVLTRWHFTPRWMTLGYALMATVCAIETFGYMTIPNKYFAMAGEYAAYIAILLVLFHPNFSFFSSQS